MPIPDFQALMLPVLRAYAESKEPSLAAIRQTVARAVKLTEDELRETLPSGRQLVIVNRVSWSIIYMERAGLLQRIRRGVYRITHDGQSLLARNPTHINKDTLRGYAAYVTWKDTLPDEKATSTPDPDNATTTPEEDLAQAADSLTHALQADLLQRIRSAGPAFLERVVVELLSAMGYGLGHRSHRRSRHRRDNPGRCPGAG